LDRAALVAEMSRRIEKLHADHPRPDPMTVVLDWPDWALNLFFGDGRPAPYGLLSEPQRIPDRLTRQQRRRLARKALN
jgi:hypothetical protein